MVNSRKNKFNKKYKKKRSKKCNISKKQKISKKNVKFIFNNFNQFGGNPKKISLFEKKLNRKFEIDINKKINELKLKKKKDHQGKSDIEIYELAKEEVIKEKIKEDMKSLINKIIIDIYKVEQNKIANVQSLDYGKVNYVTHILKYMTKSQVNEIYENHELELESKHTDLEFEKNPITKIPRDTIYDYSKHRPYVKVIKIGDIILAPPIYFYKSTGTSRDNPYDDPPKDIWLPCGSKLFNINPLNNKLRINKLEDEYIKNPKKIIDEYDTLVVYMRFINKTNAKISKKLTEMETEGKLKQYLGLPFEKE